LQKIFKKPLRHLHEGDEEKRKLILKEKLEQKGREFNSNQDTDEIKVQVTR